MTGHEERLGRTLAARLAAETDQMRVDTASAAWRLETELDQGRRHRRRLVIVAGASVLALVVGVTAWTGQSRNTDNGQPAGQDRSPEGNAQPFFLDLSTGERTPVPRHIEPANLVGSDRAGTILYSVSHDGSRLAFYTCGTSRAQEYDSAYPTFSGPGFCGPRKVTCSSTSCTATSLDVLGVVNLDGSEAHTLPAEDLTLYGARWSPDDMKLVYETKPADTPESGAVVVEDLATGERSELVDVGEFLCCSHRPYGWALGPAFGADGESVLFNLALDVASIPVTGGDWTVVLQNAAFPMPFPDGRTIAFVELPKNAGDAIDGRAIAVAALDDGSRRRLVQTDDPIWHPELSPDATRIAYQVNGVIHLVDVDSAETSQVTDGTQAVWLDDDTLLVTP